MNETIGYCGLNCQGCPIYLATREKDEEKQYKMRADIAKQNESPRRKQRGILVD